MPEAESPNPSVLIRVWHGWTTRDNAESYEALLRNEVFPGIAARDIPGYQGIQLLRRSDGEDVEFVTLMTFTSLEAIRAFAGPDETVAFVPEKARALLTRFGQRSFHYELRLFQTLEGSA